MASNSTFSERLLAAAINKSVSEKLGSYSRDISEFTKGMSAEDAKSARLMILEMVEKACVEFCAKMKARAESGKKTDSE